MKVRLIVDLTAYLSGLIVGSEGFTIGNYGEWSRGSDLFTGVEFPGIGKLDVLWKSLECIDEAVLQREAEWKANILLTAKNVVKTVGPRGGFRHLSFEYDGGMMGISFKSFADEWIDLFSKKGIQISIKS